LSRVYLRMSTTLYAGYVLPAVFDALHASGMLGDEALRALLRSWCIASVDGIEGEKKRPLDDAVVMTAANMVSRGLPTLPSVEIERLFAKSFGRTAIHVDGTGRIVSGAEGIDPSFVERLLDALKAVHPRIDSAELPISVRSSKAAGLAKVLTAPLTDLFGPAITQLLDVDEGGRVLLLPFPYPHSGMYGIRAFAVKSIEDDTPGGLDDRGWYQLPLASGDSSSLKMHLRAIRTLVPSDAIPLVVQSRQIFTEEGSEATQLALVPIATARLQRVIIELILSGTLDLSANEWRIAVIERDIPGAALAVGDLQRLFRALFALEGEQRKLPAIRLTLCTQGDLHDSALSGGDTVQRVRETSAIGSADCLIDHSLLLRSGQEMDHVQTEIPAYITVRTARRDSGMRRLYLREPVTWKGVQSGNGSQGENDAVYQAAEHLLQRCFRFAAFRPAQRKLLGHALQQKHWLASMPAGAGKSLMYQFAGLLQPAPSFVLEPLASLAMDQQDSLHDRWIDTVCCLHESLGRDARQSVRNQFVRGEALFCITTADLFRNEETVEMLKEAQNAGLYFAQGVIDEAHALSEWSHDHRFSIQGALGYAIRRLRAGKKRRLPLRMMTASVSYDVLHDLRRQFTSAGDGYVLLDDQVVLHPAMLHPALHYYMISSTVSGDDETAVASGRRQTLEKLLKRLPTLFEELQAVSDSSAQLPHFDPAAFYSASRGHSGVVFCPYPSGPLGVSHRFGDTVSTPSIADSLNQKFLRTGAFVGKDEGGTRVGRQALTASAGERLRFKEGSTNLLVSTRAFGIGSHNRRIRYTVHLNMPPGLERFVQESGRAGHDGRLALAALLYTPTDKTRSPDMLRAMELLEGTFSTPSREKQLIHDLLREISYPEDSNTGRIANLLADEYGVELRVNYWQRGLDERLYLQESGSSLGYIDLVTQKIVPDSRHPDPEYARELLEFAYDHSLEAAGSGPSLSSWVSATYPSDIDDGLLRQLTDFDAGAEFTMRIGFENDREPILTKIHKILWHDAELEIQRKLLSEIPTDSWKEFCILLEQRSGKHGALSALDPEVESRVTQLFNRLRSRIDTERIIHRLALLGLVEDYTINPAARKFSLTVRTRNEDEYRGMLERYMSTFMPSAHVQRLIESLSSCPGDSELERCLYFLVDFSYQNSQRHKREGVAIMDAASRYGLANGPAAFRTYIEHSLTAKYARADALPQALHSNDRFGILARYLDMLEEDGTASILANAAHLRASGALLSARLKGEPVVRALEMFARLMLADDQKSRQQYSDSFVEQVLACAAATGLSGQEYHDAVAPLMQRFRRYLDAEETTRLRLGLEEGEARIRKQAPAAIGTVDVPAEAKSEDTTPDINAERAVPAIRSEPPLSAQHHRPQKASASPAPRAASPAPRPASSATSRPEEPATQPAATQARPEEPAPKPTAAQARPEKLSPKSSESTTKARRPAPAVSTDIDISADLSEDNAEIEALLSDIENTIKRESQSPPEAEQETGPAQESAESPRPPAKSRVRKTAKAAASKQDAEIDEAAKLAAAMLSAEEDERREAAKREALRQQEEKVAAERAAKVAEKRASEEKKRAEAEKRKVDPVIAQQLKWLQTFNTRFLKSYES